MTLRFVLRLFACVALLAIFCGPASAQWCNGPSPYSWSGGWNGGWQGYGWYPGWQWSGPPWTSGCGGPPGYGYGYGAPAVESEWLLVPHQRRWHRARVRIIEED